MQATARSFVRAAVSAPRYVARRTYSESQRQKDALVSRLLTAKDQAGVTYDEIAKKLKVTNVYVAQLFTNQAQLKPATAEKLKALVPGITDADLIQMQKCPTRSFDPALMQEPLVYRLVEAMQHYGLGIKNILNEKKGDGIISAIDIYLNMDIVKGTQGEDRFVLTLNGKFLPHVEQLNANNTASTTQKEGTGEVKAPRIRAKKSAVEAVTLEEAVSK